MRDQLKHGAYESSALYGDGLVSQRIADGLVKLEPYVQKRLHYIYDEESEAGTIMRILGIITARGGSKGIPRKNLASLLGKPLLAYTIEAALASRKLTRTVLSTDDAEIAGVGKQWGVDVPFFRPPELARDNTSTIPVLQDVVRRLELMGETYDAILTLQPTNPLRRVEDIDGAIDLLRAMRRRFRYFLLGSWGAPSRKDEIYRRRGPRHRILRSLRNSKASRARN